jgi:flagella basal body P-ring formation protein FlgA
MMRLPRLVASALAAALCGLSPLCAEERMLPVPVAVIYPGEVIRESMLVERAFGAGAGGSVAETKSALVGKVARRTLLPDQPIPPIAVDAPKVVSINAPVKIVFDEGGMVIIAYGSALQPGAVGDLIRVRNQDSGLVVTGRVQADGSIRVSEG